MYMNGTRKVQYTMYIIPWKITYVTILLHQGEKTDLRLRQVTMAKVSVVVENDACLKLINGNVLQHYTLATYMKR